MKLAFPHCTALREILFCHQCPFIFGTLGSTSMYQTFLAHFKAITSSLWKPSSNKTHIFCLLPNLYYCEWNHTCFSVTYNLYQSILSILNILNCSTCLYYKINPNALEARYKWCSDLITVILPPLPQTSRLFYYIVDLLLWYYLIH